MKIHLHIKKNLFPIVLLIFIALACSNSKSTPQNNENKSPIYCSEMSLNSTIPSSPGPFVDDSHRFLFPDGSIGYMLGTTIYTGGYPMEPKFSANGNFLIVTDNDNRGNNLQKLLIYEIKGKRSTIVPTTSFRGVWIKNEGGFLQIYYAGGWKGDVKKISYNTRTSSFSTENSFQLEGFVSDLIYDPFRKLLYAFNLGDGEIWSISPDTGEIKEITKSGAAVYDSALTPDGKYLLLSDWTGDSIVRVDLTTREVKKLKVGKFPEEIVIYRDKSYVSISGEDIVVEFSYDELKILHKISLKENNSLGLYPSGLTICPSKKWLLVTLSRGNYVDVIDLDSNKIIGKIPTLWFPSGIACNEKVSLIAISNSKGLGGEHWSGKYRMSQWNLSRGIVSLIPIPDDSTLKKYTSIVEENLRLQAEAVTSPCHDPGSYFRSFPIEHVVLIVRENKTYDEDLGDLEAGNGDPELTLFGENVTPNLHELAREFTNCDNFYSNPEVSFQGHVWTTHADLTDYLDKMWQNSIPFAGVETAATSSSGSFFQHLLNNGVDFRIYGEVAGVGEDIFGPLWSHVDMKYPFYNLDIPDVEKAEEFIRELKNGILKTFTYISLPDDHTYGYLPGKPMPESMVADNDEATGMIIDAISHSPFWEKSLIFIIEDDPQSFAGDHVEAHRSICVVIGPHVKRHFVSHTPYSIPSIFKTIELLWGLPHLNRNTALAIPMFDIFSEKADLTPYRFIPRKISVNYVPQNHPLAEESKEVFKDIDESPGLGYILWRGIKGDIPPPPYATGIDR